MATIFPLHRRVSAMSRILIIFPVLALISLCWADDIDLVYNGFDASSLILRGNASLSHGALLSLTTEAAGQFAIGHAFFPTPLILKSSGDGKREVPSFSTDFVIACVPGETGVAGHGMAFVISPSNELAGALPAQYLGLFNTSNNGNPANNVTAVEFDVIANPEFQDINSNHVGIDVNSVISLDSVSAGYYSRDNGSFQNVDLGSGERIRVWVEYNETGKTIEVKLAPVAMKKPSSPLLSTAVDFSSFDFDAVYVGFSAATGTLLTSHYVLGWSFRTNGQARPLDISRLPNLPPRSHKNRSRQIVSGVVSAVVVVVLLLLLQVVFIVRRRRRYSEILEDWERQIGAHRIPYKHLFVATKGFKDEQVIGAGGFGKVYKGVLSDSKIEVAVKKVTHDSDEGTRQFLAEITSLGRIRDPNFVELLGYCRRKGELLLVYEFMPNSSLDKFLYGQPRKTLNWKQRFKIIHQVASGLFFLHERWTQTVLHRDIKASNVLLDADFNAKLGDFGLSRLYDHGSDPHTTRLVGTVGYIAPELNRTGKATKSTDVYAFGIFLLEVVCGRRPMDVRAEQIMLVDWVSECFREGRILRVVDRKLQGTGYGAEEMKEMELVLKLGLLCSLEVEVERPHMELVMRFLTRDEPLPEVPLAALRANITASTQRLDIEGSPSLLMSSPSLESNSLLVCGR